MSYVVLARRYRPQRFADLVGQEHVTQTLRNAVLQSRSAHAYLFTGPRGVGKTSAARILARAIRCLELGADGEPCNRCDACQGVLDGSSMDVLEIDAASNTGVDNIRNLRETVEYLPTISKHRIYIIDEVHMLSTAAFNALLKTLEEPPPHVVFIFATTELHKVLPTIQSRCQRFDFKKITPSVMREKLLEITKAEGVSIDDHALTTLILESEGCLRDAESLLDQCIALCGKEITLLALEGSLSLLDRRSLFDLLAAVGTHNTQAALKCTAALLDRGIDPKTVINRLTDAFAELHHLVFAREFKMADSPLNPALETLKTQLSPDEVIRAFDLGLRTQGSLSQIPNAGFALESFVVKLCLQRPIAAREVSGVTLPATAPVVSAAPQHTTAHQNTMPSPTVMAAPPYPTRSAPQATAPVRAATSGVSSSPSASDIGALEDFVRNTKPAWTPVLGSVLEVVRSGEVIKIRARADFAGKRLASPDGIEVLKSAYQVKRAEVVLEKVASLDDGPSPQEVQMQKAQLAREHAAVKSALDIFKGTITETKILHDDGKSKVKS